MQIIKSAPAGLNGICYGILAGLQTLWKDAEARSRLHFHEHFLEPPHGISLTSRLPLPPVSEPHRLCRDPWSCHTCDSSPHTSAITCASTEGVLGLALFSHSSWPNQISHVSARACSHGYTFCSQGRFHSMGSCQRQPLPLWKKNRKEQDFGCPPMSFSIILFSAYNGNSMAVQWLGLSTFTAGTRVQSPVRELRSRKPCGLAKTNKSRYAHIVM